MFKKILLVTMLMAVSSSCFADQIVTVEMATPDPTGVVNGEIAKFGKLPKLAKARLLVSHKNVADEVQARKDAYMRIDRNVTVQKAKTAPELKLKPAKPAMFPKAESQKVVVPEKTESLSEHQAKVARFKEQLRAQEAQEKALADSDDVSALKKQLAQSQKENAAMKTELKKSIDAMERIKQKKR